jgi:short-subunit dehydrogenase
MRRLALITGASAGIGEALARVYAARGFDLALTARRDLRLKALADQLGDEHGTKALILTGDLADDGVPDALLASVAAAGRQVDVLINNAGYGLPGTYASTTWDDQAAFLKVMLTAPCELTHKVLPGMVDRRFGRIINVASLAGLVPGSRGHTLYSAVKAGLIKFSESLNAELRGTGVHATAVCPGFTYSEFHDVNGTRGQVSQMPRWMWQAAEDVAETSFTASEANQAVIVTGGPNKAIATLAKLLPDGVARGLVRGQSARFRRAD